MFILYRFTIMDTMTINSNYVIERYWILLKAQRYCKIFVYIYYLLPYFFFVLLLLHSDRGYTCWLPVATATSIELQDQTA